MSNMTTVDGINEALDATQWVLVWDAGIGLIVAAAISSTQVTTSKYTMEVFDTEGALTTRVGVLGYEMPTDE